MDRAGGFHDLLEILNSDYQKETSDEIGMGKAKLRI